MPTDSSQSKAGRIHVVVVAIAVIVGACGSRPERSVVVSHLEGFVSVRTEVDSVRDYRGFEVLVAAADGSADTLGFAVTDSTGAFRMDVTASERGIYPLLVRRRGALLKQGQIVIAAGDSATLNLRLPDGQRPLVIRSVENAAWLAYRNTKAVHNRSLLSLAQSGDLSSESRNQRFMQTAEVLWKLSDQFPGTIGAEVAAAESVMMLEGVDDSAAVVRGSRLDVNSSNFADVARAVRRAESRIAGLQAAIDMLESYVSKASTSSRKAALTSEIVLALVDSGRVDAALSRARDLRARYPDTQWAGWAEGAVYELENLMPGMEAPTFRARMWGGGLFDLSDVRNGAVVLDFFRPMDEQFLRELTTRNDAIASIRDAGITYVSVSVDPDSVINEAFFESRDTSSVRIALPGGLEDSLAHAYNVMIVPKRFLISEGRIVAKYSGIAAMESIRRDAISLMAKPAS